MENGNDSEPKTKLCPFLNKECIQEQCALYSEMKRVTGGLQQQFGACSFLAMVLIMSEMNRKAQVSSPKINIPNLMRGS